MTFSPDDIHKELIPSTSRNMQNSYRDYTKHLPVSYGVLPVRQMNDPGGGYQLGDGKEQLMVPLGVEVVVPVININPPRVIMGEQSGRKEEHH